VAEGPELARRHAEYFLRLAEADGGEGHDADHDETSAALTPEIDNLRAALAWALSPDGDAALGAALAAATAPFWSGVGLLTERRTWLSQAVEAPGVEPPVRSRLKRLLDSDRAPAPSDEPSPAAELRH